MDDSIEPDWVEVFRATSYEAGSGEGAVRIRIGEPTPALEPLLAGHAPPAWCFITAWNPGARPLPQAENEQRNRELRARLDAAGHVFLEGLGRPDAPGWPPEASFLVLGIERAAAVALARDFGQVAIVVGSQGSIAELAACEPPPDGSVHTPPVDRPSPDE